MCNSTPVQQLLCLVQIFEGNTHYDTPELRHFEETVAQYIRLYPERWSPAGIGMRVEILGCDLPGRSCREKMLLLLLIHDVIIAVCVGGSGCVVE